MPLLIVHVIPGGPAAEAGMAAERSDRRGRRPGRPRDVSSDAAADMLKGPEFSYVDVVLQSPDGAVRSLRVQRRRVEVPSVQDVKIVDPQNGVAYLKLTSFQKTTSRDVDAALWSLHRQGMRSLIIDVRGNPGGLLNAAVEVADKFLPSGIIVSTRGRSTREDFDYQAHSVGTWRVPLVVLIDGDSASASEIFAGAIRRPWPRHGGGTTQLRQGQRAGHLPAQPLQVRHPPHDLQVLLAQRAADQRSRRHAARGGPSGPDPCGGARDGLSEKCSRAAPDPHAAGRRRRRAPRDHQPGGPRQLSRAWIAQPYDCYDLTVAAQPRCRATLDPVSLDGPSRGRT